MELAKRGDLLAFLRNTEENNLKFIQSLDSSEESTYIQLHHPLLFTFIWQIAEGMQYLSQKKVSY